MLRERERSQRDHPLTAIQLLKPTERHPGKATEQIIVIVTIAWSNLRVELIHPRDSPSPSATIYLSPALSSRTPHASLSLV